MADNEKANQGEASVRTIQYKEGRFAGILSVMRVKDYKTLKENNPELPTVYLHLSNGYCKCIQYDKSHWVVSSVDYIDAMSKGAGFPDCLQINYCEEQKQGFFGQSSGAGLQIMEETSGWNMARIDSLWERNRDWREGKVNENATIYLMTAKDYQECFETRKAACAKHLMYCHARHYVRGVAEEGTFLGGVPGVVTVNDNRQFYTNADWFVEKFGKHAQKCKVGVVRIEGDELKQSFQSGDVAHFLCEYYLDKYMKIPEDIWKWHGWMLNNPINDLEYGSKVIEFTLKKGNDTKEEANQSGTLIILSAKDFIKYRAGNKNQAIVGIKITDEECLGFDYGKDAWITSTTEFFLALGKSIGDLRSEIKIATAQYHNNHVKNIQSVSSIYKPNQVFNLYKAEYEKNILSTKHYALGNILIYEKVPVFILMDSEYELVRDRFVQRQKDENNTVYCECRRRINQKTKDGKDSTWEVQGILDLEHYRFYTGAKGFVERTRGVPQKFEMRTVWLNRKEKKWKQREIPCVRENTKRFYDYFLFLKNGTRSIDGTKRKSTSVEAEGALPKGKAESEEALKRLREMGALDFREQTPPHGVIYLFSKKCHCSNCDNEGNPRNIYDKTALVKAKTGFGVPITVQCCGWCGRVYMNYQMYKAYDQKYGGLEFRAEMVVSEAVNATDGLGFSADSFLSRNGYSVKEDVPKSTRREVLANILDGNIATKQEIIEKITEFINLRRNDPKMDGAIARWEEDIAFVADYKASRQDNIGEHEIHQAGKITEPLYQNRKN